MADFELIEERTMSGVGLLRLQADENTRQMLVVSQVIRKPTNEFINADWSPEKSVYARITELSDASVHKAYLQEFSSQIFVFTPDVAGQALIAVNCAYEGILQSFFELATCIAECVPIGKTNLVADMHTLPSIPTQMVFNLYTDTAISVKLYHLAYDKCGALPLPPVPPPPPTPSPEIIPPGTPIDDITPPYDGDDEFTEPDILDEVDEPTDPGVGDFDPPVGDDCDRIAITTIVRDVDGNGNPTENTSENIYFAPVTGYGYIPGANPGSRSWVVYCRGNFFGGCIEPGAYSGGELSNSITGSVEFVSAVNIDA